MIGRRYHVMYGYPWRWAILAEVCWRLEHCGVGSVERFFYPRRKAAERRGYQESRPRGEAPDG